MNVKLMLGVVALSTSAMAMNANATISSGPCSASDTSAVDCAQWDNSHTTLNNWFGPSGTSADSDVFTFSGDTQLSCPNLPSLNCDLTLKGQLRINTETGNDLSLRVLDGSVTAGDLLCGAVDLGGYTWYIGDNSYHGPYDESTYVTDPVYANSIPLFSIGNIDLHVPVPLFPVNISDSHMHGVQYVNNSPSYFQFTNAELVTGGSADNGTGCTVTGILEDVDNRDILIY